jgi:hypothetical protein
MWYHKIIGKEKCPIVDTWWQTVGSQETRRRSIVSLCRRSQEGVGMSDRVIANWMFKRKDEILQLSLFSTLALMDCQALCRTR